jgi:hypothetical protein
MAPGVGASRGRHNAGVTDDFPPSAQQQEADRIRQCVRERGIVAAYNDAELDR